MYLEIPLIESLNLEIDTTWFVLKIVFKAIGTLLTYIANVFVVFILQIIFSFALVDGTKIIYSAGASVITSVIISKRINILFVSSTYTKNACSFGFNKSSSLFGVEDKDVCVFLSTLPSYRHPVSFISCCS